MRRQNPDNFIGGKISRRKLFLIAAKEKVAKRRAVLDVAVVLINPLRPSIKLQILLLCFHTFITYVKGRSCSNINRISFE